MFWPSDSATSNATPGRFCFWWVHLALCTAEALDFNDFRSKKASFEASNFPCSKWLGKDASSALPERAEERKHPGAVIKVVHFALHVHFRGQGMLFFGILLPALGVKKRSFCF